MPKLKREQRWRSKHQGVTAYWTSPELAEMANTQGKVEALWFNYLPSEGPGRTVIITPHDSPRLRIVKEEHYG